MAPRIRRLTTISGPLLAVLLAAPLAAAQEPAPTPPTSGGPASRTPQTVGALPVEPAPPSEEPPRLAATGAGPSSVAADPEAAPVSATPTAGPAPTSTPTPMPSPTAAAAPPPAAGSPPAPGPTTPTAGPADSELAQSLRESRPEVAWSVSLAKILWAVLVAAVGYLAIRTITRILENLAERRPRARLAIKAAVPIIRIVGWTFLIYFVVAHVFAPPIETLLALTASAGIAIGFASQDILKNIFGGIIILLDRPFQVGDKVEIGSHYGEVVDIGLRTVRLVTPDDSVVAVPNSEVVSQAVANANAGESNCQVVAEVYLPPHVDTAAVRRIAIRAAQVSRYAYLNKPVVVLFRHELHHGRSMLKMRLKAYVLDIRFEFPFASDMTETVIAELLARGLVRSEELA